MPACWGSARGTGGSCPPAVALLASLQGFGNLCKVLQDKERKGECRQGSAGSGEGTGRWSRVLWELSWGHQQGLKEAQGIPGASSSWFCSPFAQSFCPCCFLLPCPVHRHSYAKPRRSWKAGEPRNPAWGWGRERAAVLAPRALAQSGTKKPSPGFTSCLCSCISPTKPKESRSRAAAPRAGQGLLSQGFSGALQAFRLFSFSV